MTKNSVGSWIHTGTISVNNFVKPTKAFWNQLLSVVSRHDHQTGASEQPSSCLYSIEGTILFYISADHNAYFLSVIGFAAISRSHPKLVFLGIPWITDLIVPRFVLLEKINRKQAADLSRLRRFPASYLTWPPSESFA